MKSTLKLLLQLAVLALALAATVWLASGDRLRHYPDNRVLNQSAISAIQTTGPVGAGFELVQPIDTTHINASHPDLFKLPLCVQVFLDATDGTYFPGVLHFELKARERTALATLHSDEIPNSFKRICFPDATLDMLIGAPDAQLRITIPDANARNVARVVLTPLPEGASPARINGQIGNQFLPHMIEVQRPLTPPATTRVLALLAFAAATLLIIFRGLSAAPRRDGPP